MQYLVLAYLYFRPVMQYLDLAFLFYLDYYVLASILLVITVSSAFVSTAELCKAQKELFKSIDEQRLIPLVQNGRVRCGPHSQAAVSLDLQYHNKWVKSIASV